MPPVAVAPSVRAEAAVAPQAGDGKRRARQDTPPAPRPQGSPEPPSAQKHPARDAERHTVRDHPADHRTVRDRPARDTERRTARDRPAPERRAERPPTLPRQGLPDPCATFNDFRRGACHAFLERLTR